MKHFLALAAVVVSLPLFAGEDASDKRPPLTAFYGDTQFGLLTCSLHIMIAVEKTKAAELGSPMNDKEGGDFRACISDSLETVKPRYEKALKFSKSSAKKTALKNYYAAWISTMQALPPRMDELKISYRKRTADAEDRLKELWAKVEIEQ